MKSEHIFNWGRFCDEIEEKPLRKDMTSYRRQQVEDTLERIQSHKGVVGLVIVSEDGIPIRTTLDNSTTLQYVVMCNTLCGVARGVVRDTDPQNDLKILRVRTKKNEIIMAPEGGRYLIVIQTGDQPQQQTFKDLLE